MGQRQSQTAAGGGKDNTSSSNNANNQQVRTGATNATLVNNFEGFFPVSADGAAGHQTPRTSVHHHQAASSRTPQSSNKSGDIVNNTHQSGNTSQDINQDAAAATGGNSLSSNITSTSTYHHQHHSPTAPLCLRYKYQLPSKQPQAPQGNQRGQIPLPPAPQQGVSVDLFDGDGKHIANVPLNASEGEFFAVVPVQTPPMGDTRPLTQYFRFVVDGHRGVCHPHLPTAPMPNSNNGSGMAEQSNWVHVFNTEEDSENQNQQNQQQQSVGRDGANQQQQAPPPPMPNAVHSSSIIYDDDGWTQQAPQFEETRKFPPIMPPHLRYTPLNAPPSNIRIIGDVVPPPQASSSNNNNNRNNNSSNFSGNTNNTQQNTADPSSTTSNNGLTITSEDDVNEAHDRGDNSISAQLLPRMVEGADQRPAPLSVTINHVYFQKREDHTLVGITTRYQNKCTSIAYYKHDPLPVGAVPLPMPLQR